MESSRGQLLIAGPALADPNFWRTVVLIVEHTEEGALGLVLNRASETTAGEAVPGLAELLDPESLLFVGGPVQPSAVVILGEFEDPGDAAVIAFDEIGVLTAEPSAELLSAGVREARAFAGHSGWGPGQLEAELESGSWILEPARREDAFCADPDSLWSDVLARKGGRYRLVARMPIDPSLN
jgi:putative transcriptional regulator